MQYYVIVFGRTFIGLNCYMETWKQMSLFLSKFIKRKVSGVHMFDKQVFVWTCMCTKKVSFHRSVYKNTQFLDCHIMICTGVY